METGERKQAMSVTDGGDQNDTLRKGTWTAEEDSILSTYVTKYGGGDWKTVQERAGINRSAKSCRLRWRNHLRTNLKKGRFSPEEEIKIIDIHAQLGNKWAQIALQFPGRTDNDIKNYVNALIRKALRARSKAAAALQLSIDRFNMRNHHTSHSLPQLDNRREATFGSIEGSHIDATVTASVENLNMPLDIPSDVHGSADSDTMMKDCMRLWDIATELSRNLECFSPPNVAMGQPQPVSTLTEKVCTRDDSASASGTYVNDCSDYVHGNQHHNISMNHGMMQNEEPDANRFETYPSEMPLVQSEWENTPSQGGFFHNPSALDAENSEPAENLAQMFRCYPSLLDSGNSNLYRTISGNPDAGSLLRSNQQPCYNYVDPLLDYASEPRGTPSGVMSNTVPVLDSAISSQINIPSWNWNSFQVNGDNLGFDD